MDGIENAVAKGFRDLTKQVVKNIQFATVTGYSGNILAAKIMSAKTAAERNEAIKQSEKQLQNIQETIERWEIE
jgi:hypothetical protein